MPTKFPTKKPRNKAHNVRMTKADTYGLKWIADWVYNRGYMVGVIYFTPFTLPKTNIANKNGGLEHYFPFVKVYFFREND